VELVVRVDPFPSECLLGLLVLVPVPVGDAVALNQQRPDFIYAKLPAVVADDLRLVPRNDLTGAAGFDLAGTV